MFSKALKFIDFFGIRENGVMDFGYKFTPLFSRMSARGPPWV